MTATPPATLPDFKARFDRDFAFGKGTDRVRDQDILNAFNDAFPVFNASLFSTDDARTAFLYAAAHMLVTNVQAAGGLGGVSPQLGTQNRGGGIVANKTVGGVSVQYAGLETWVQKFPALTHFMRTDYGQKYLLLLKPRLTGNVAVVGGPQAPDLAVPSIPFVGP